MEDESNLLQGPESANQQAPVSTFCLSKELRIDIEPANPASVIQIQLPSGNTFSRAPKSQRRVLKAIPTFKDEQTFSHKYLARASSICFSKSRAHPRSFLWRLLEGDRVLEVRSVDLSKSVREKREGNLVLQLGLPAAVSQRGVALADDGQGTLSVFLLTKGNELFTVTLRPELFCDAAASKEEATNWCKLYKPATFSISTPHLLIAGSPTLLIASLADGKLLRLTRESGGDGSIWHETTYSDGQWGSSLRGLIRWQGNGAIRYDGNILDQSTAIAIALSPTQKHVVTVCANHTLKIWNLEKPSSVFQMDLLGESRQPQDLPKMMLDPGNSNVLQVFEAEGAIDGDQYYIMTFSPHDQGHFKIWAIRDADQGRLGVRYLFPEASFHLPDPDASSNSNAVWKMTDFKIKGATRGMDMALWVLMRSNKKYQTFNLKFDLDNLADTWQGDWTIVASEFLDQQNLPHPSDMELRDASELWLDYILRPGRFSRIILEAGLAIYAFARPTENASSSKASLEERMCLAIKSRLDMQSGTISGTDYDQHRTMVHQEWSLLYHDIQDLHKSLWKVSALSYDSYTEIPWLIFAGGCAPLRDCSRSEILAHNSPDDLSNLARLLESRSVEDESSGRSLVLPDALAVILKAAAKFRESFSPSLRLTCHIKVAAELWQDPSHALSSRIQSLYDQCDLGGAIGNGAVDELYSALAEGLEELDNSLFWSILDDLSHFMSRDASGLASTDFGLKAIIRGAQEMIELHYSMLFDLLMLVVLLEVEPINMPMERFDASVIYASLIEQLKSYQMMMWLASNGRQKLDSHAMNLEDGSKKNGADSSFAAQEQPPTILETLFAADLEPQSSSRQTQSAALTYSIQDVLNWVTGGNDTSITLDQVLVNVQCNFLVNKDLDLASDFLKFQPTTPWATYIKGRFYLLHNDFTKAAMYFQKAAFKLCTSLSNPIPNPSHYH